MNKKHLFWIIPLVLLIGIILGGFIIANGTANVLYNHPVVNCIFHGEDSLNIDSNGLPYTKESQRYILSQRCMSEYYNPSWSYDDLVFGSGYEVFYKKEVI